MRRGQPDEMESVEVPGSLGDGHREFNLHNLTLLLRRSIMTQIRTKLANHHRTIGQNLPYREARGLRPGQYCVGMTVDVTDTCRP